MAINVATGTTSTDYAQGKLQAEQQTYFAKQLLKQANYTTVLDQFGHTEKIPSNSSKVIQFNQYADLGVATTPLSEGTPPTETLLTVTPIQATVDQLGAYVPLTDLAGLTTKHPVVTKVNELLGDQAARTYDDRINATLVAGTNVFYPGAIASRATLDTANVLTFAEIKKGVAYLRTKGAKPFSDGNFVCVIDPSVEFDLMTDANFQNTVYRQTGKNENYKGAIVSFAGVTFVRSNVIGTITGGVGGNKAIHTSHLFGQDAYAVTDLQTLQMYSEKPGGVTDPLHQKMTMGWKVAFKSIILNQNWVVRFESVSAY